MIRQLLTPLLLVTIIIAAILLGGCKDEVFLTVVADPPTIGPNETSLITAVATTGKEITTAKPIKDAAIRLWLPQTEKAFAQLEKTSVTTGEHGSAVVQLQSLDIPTNKTIHVTAKVEETTCNCIVIIKQRPSEATAR